MTVTAPTTFDLAAYKRAFESWDLDVLLSLYAEDAELVQIDRDNPPSAPRVRHGKDVFRGMFEHCAAAGVKPTVDNTLTGDGLAAATITCDFPGGRRVMANSILEIEDGLIVRERDILAGDPKGS